MVWGCSGQAWVACWVMKGEDIYINNMYGGEGSYTLCILRTGWGEVSGRD